jgi:hypothetical protein
MHIHMHKTKLNPISIDIDLQFFEINRQYYDCTRGLVLCIKIYAFMGEWGN